MVRIGAVLFALWAGTCVGLNGQELGLAFGSSMTDMADVDLGEDALPQVPADQGTSQLFSRHEEDVGLNALLKRQRRYCPSGSRKFLSHLVPSPNFSYTIPASPQTAPEGYGLLTYLPHP